MADTAEGEAKSRSLSSEEKLRLGVLALPTTALALAITIVSTYLGTVTRRYTHDTTLIGAIIGGEGFMALWVPLIAGSWSDQARSRIGGRLPFVIAGGVPAAAALFLIGFMHSLVAVAVAAAAFFLFYFVAYEPYRALYPDLMDNEAVAGRAQSTQALARGVGTGLALLGGGLLLSVARPLPFVVAAVLLLAAIGLFVWLLVRRGLDDNGGTDEQSRPGASPWATAARLPQLVRENRVLRLYFVANALWEMALAALKAFIILYLVHGLHYGLRTASLIVGGVAIVILLGAVGSGILGDRIGKLRVMNYALWAYGIGYTVAIFTTSKPVIGVAIPFIAIGGGTVMTLAYAILMPLMPDDEHGALTGFYSLSRGVGIVSGPIIAGLLISVTQHGPLAFGPTHGYAAMWIVCAAASFASIPLVRAMRRLGVESGLDVETDP
ncbi:MAG TPA: MFS transporter [Solirubrobacteraceae bacterium]|nr:MFS transporter [Solirubrobacteraceae bacterium]